MAAAPSLIEVKGSLVQQAFKYQRKEEVSVNIKLIEKSELSSVVFIRDYVQFVFEGEKENIILSAFTSPSTMAGNQVYHIQTSGWRDALCTLINKVVKTAFAEERNAIKITFEGGDSLEISLKEEDYDGPEAAMLYTDDGKVTVW